MKLAARFKRLTHDAPASPPLTMELTQGQTADRQLVGGKGASLAQMSMLGLPVPSAFALTTEAFREFREHTTGLDPSAFETATLPARLAAALEGALAQLPGSLFAVRSSATLEDGHEHSMAGQLDTFLNVPRAEVARAVKRCWSSLFAARAQAYLAQLSSDERAMAVVVQVQVDPAWAGVAFSLDPVTRSCDELVVEWTEGLGDKLVSGEIDPARLKMARLHPEADAALPHDLTARLTELHAQVLKLEKALACPVDVEWCATQEQLYVLQVRPITTLDREDHQLWSNVNLTENFPNPLAPMAWSVIERFYESYMRGTLNLFGWREQEFRQVQHLLSSLTGTHGGRIYYNLSSWYRLISYFPRGQDLQRFLNTYIGQGIPIDVPPDQRAPALRASQQSAWGTLRLATHLLRAFAGTARRIDGLDQELTGRRRAWRQRLTEADDARSALQIVNEMLALVTERWQGPCGADLMVMIVPSLLSQLLESWTDAATSARAMPCLLQGVSVKSDEPSQQLWQLSQHIKALRARPGFDTARARQAEATSRAMFQDFIERFGARCYNDCSLITPTFEEQPELAWQLVDKFEQLSDRFSAAAKQPLVETREQTLSELCQRLPAWQAAIVVQLLRLSLKAIQNREAGRMQQSILFGELRGAVRRAGELLAKRRALATGDDVFFCTLPEIDALSRNALPDHEALPEAILRRKRQHLAQREQFPPSAFLLPAAETVRAPVAETAGADGAEASSSVLRGLTVSRGSTEGIARVVRDPSAGDTLEPGQILVASSTDPGWTPLFMLASGLILERGGMLSHGAIVAREMDIPALVGVKDACTRITSGTKIRLDANSGVIELSTP